MTTAEFYQRHNGKRVRWIKPGSPHYGWDAKVVGYDAPNTKICVESNYDWIYIYQSWLDAGYVEVIDDEPLPLPG